MSKTLTATYSSGYTLSSLANNPLTLSSTARISKPTGLGGALYARGGASNWTINNFGTVLGGTVGSTRNGALYIGAGVSSVSSSLVINETGGVIQGGHYGVRINGSGTIVNQSGGLIYANAQYAIYVTGTGTVVNAGTITAANVGAIKVNGGSVTNQSGGIIDGATGIYFGSTGTLTNAGTIIETGGFNAVYFQYATPANRLIVDPGAVFQGEVNGGTGYLELASGSSAGTLTSFAANGITNFSTLRFDPSAQWTVKGNSSPSGLGTMAITGFTTGDTIDLTGFNASSKSFSSNALVLTNAATQHATLHIQGSFTTNNFQITSDGSGGTDIVLGAASTYDWTGSSGDWNTATNWSSGIVPGASATATIANTGSNTVTISSSESIGVAGITLSNGNTLLVDGTFATSGTIGVSGARLSVASAGQFTDNGTLTDAGTILGYITIGQTAAPLSITSGAYFGNGTAHTALYAAQAATIINQGTLDDHAAVAMSVGYYAIRLANGGSIDNIGTILGNGFAALSPSNGVSLTNSGLISGSARDGMLANGAININNSGTILGNSDAVVARNGALTLTNTGTLAGASAVLVQNGFATLTNQGVMTGTAGSAVQVADGGRFVNQAGGVISAANAHTAVYFGGNGYTASAYISLTNAGTIAGGSGIVSYAGNTLAQTVIDSGTIIGRSASAVMFGGGNDLMQFQPSSSAFIQGTVNGAGGSNTLEFASGASIGTLTGSAADFVNFQTMQVDAGASWVLAGSDSFSLGVNLFDRGSLSIAGTVAANIYGIAQAPLTVDASGDLSNGGTGAAFYAIYSNSGTVVNFGTIAASGGAAGDAGVRLKGSGSVANAGTITGHYGLVAYGYLTVSNSGTIGSGSRDGIFLRGGGSVGNTGVILGSVGIAGPASSQAVTVNNSGTIDGQDGIALNAADTTPATVIDSGTIIGLSGPAVQFGNGNAEMLFQPSTSAFIQGGVAGGAGSNTLAFASGATAGTLTGSNAYFVNFADGTIATGATWVFAGTNTLGAGSTLVDGGNLTLGGTFTNAGSLVADPPVTVTGTFINSSAVSGASGVTPIYVANGGVLTNTSGGTISGAVSGVSAAGTATIDNLGIIQGSTFAAIRMAAGAVINGAASVTGASILGAGYGIRASGVATVTNYGFITASSQDGVFLAAGGSLVNNGVIAANEYGVLLYGAGTITNTGTISGFGGGIITNNAADVVVNSGIISGTAGAGIVLQAGGTVFDSGTINSTGDDSVLFRGTASNLLVLEHGYKLSGPVAGSTAAASNVVELLGTAAANAVTATYNSLSLTHVGTIAFAPGNANYATLRITDDATLPGTIANFTGTHDVVDLTSLAFVSGSSIARFDAASGKLTASNGVSSVTLQLGGGSYSGLRFNASSDGAGGTDITVGPAPSYLWTGGSADWNTATNWSGGIVASTLASATIANAGSNTVTISSGESVQVTGLTLSNNNTLLVAGTFEPTGSLSATDALVSIASTGLVTGFGIVTVNNGTMLNSGTLNSDVTLNSGQFTNQAGGRVVNGYFYGVSGSSGNSVANFGSISASSGYAVYLRGAGNVSNAAGALIFGPTGVRLAGAAASVTNLGSIDAYQAFLHSYAVYLRNGGVVANGQAGDTTAAITGYYGIGIHSAPGTVVNDATVVATATSGAAVDLAASGVVINGASTLTTALLRGGGKGVYASAGTVINYGTISATQASGGAFGVLISNGGTLSNLGSTALIQGYYGAQLAINGTVINAGTIASTQGTNGNALSFGLGNARLIVDPGAVFIGNVYGVSSGSTTLELAGGVSQGTFTGLGTQFQRVNATTIDASASWVFSGNNTVGAASLFTDAGTLTNIGSLVVDPPITVTGTFINSSTVTAPGSYTAFDLAGAGVLSNAATGIIAAGGIAVTAAGTGAVSVVNLGTIQGDLATTTTYGVILSNGTIVNGAPGYTAALISGNNGAEIGSGLIDNDATIAGRYAGAGVLGAGQLTNQTGGVITGYAAVGLAGAGAAATNFGVVSGTHIGGLLYNTGELMINRAGGLITGTTIAGVALDPENTGLSTQTLVDYGTISGKYGIDNAAVLSGATLQATIVDAGTIIGTGGTAIAAGATSADVSLTLRFVPGSAFIQGTIVGEDSGTGILQFASGASAGTLTGSNADFVNFQTASVDAGANWALAGGVTLGSGVTLANAGTLDNTGTLTLLGAIADSGRLINDGSINAASYGAVQLAAGGYLRNDASGQITRGTIGATSFNAGVIGLSGGPSTIFNLGTILNSHGDLGVYLRGGGVVINGATNATAALISATVALYAEGLATVSNFGTMSGATGIEAYGGGTITNGASNATAALVSGGQYGVVLDDTGTFTNYGTVTGTANDAVRLRYGAVVMNAGRITGAMGIVAQIGAAQITNTGTIIGTGGDGIQLAGNGTVIDSGAITGSGTAIAFNGSGSNLLVLEQGYALSGRVLGAAGGSNTLELLGTSAANAVVANYNSLSLSNFGTLAFATGGTNYATLTITNDAALPHTITGFTGFHDTIDLTGLAFVGGTSDASFNTASDQLTISNGASSVVLQLGSGSYAGDAWGVTNDGSGGTDVLPIPPGAPSITSSANLVGVPDQNATTPFNVLTVTDANSTAHPDTLTVTMAAPGDGTFSTTVTGGSYNAATGTYTFTGTAAQVTAALQALQFTSSAPGAGNLIATTSFTVQVVGIGGTASNDQISVTTVTQPAALDNKPLSEDKLSISPDGTGFAAPTGGDNNEAVITNPAGGGTYSLPGGYQAVFLGGTVDATLTDQAGGNAVLAGNDGNDTLRAAAGNDTLIGGTGSNLLSISGASGFVQAGTGTDTIVATGTLDTVVASGHATVTASGGGQQVLGNFSGTGSLSVTASGNGDTISAGDSSVTGSIAGSGGIVYGGFGSIAGTLNLTVKGSNDTVNPGNSNATVRSSGGSELVYGGFGPDPGALNVSLSGANDTVNPGGSAATVTAMGNSALIYGTFGSITGGLHATVGGSGDTVNPGNDPATVLASGSGDLVYGGFGPNAAGLTTSVTGGNDTVNPGRSAATVFASGNDALIEGYFSTGGGGQNVQLSGANDTVNPGLDAATVRASGSGDLILGSFTTPGGGLAVMVTGANDTVEPGNTPATITAQAGSSGLWVWGGAGALTFNNTGTAGATLVGGSGNIVAGGGNGVLTFLSGAGSSTITGGAGGTTLYGAAGGNMTEDGGPAGVAFVAGSGNETLNAAGSASNDTLFAGAGSLVLAAGHGTDTFVFYRNLTAGAGAHDLIGNFAGSDQVLLSGYGGNEAPVVLANAVSSGGNTTITLSDNTQITFLNIASASALSGHLVSV